MSTAPNKPSSWLDGRDLGTLSGCSTWHWRLAGIFAVTHEIIVSYEMTDNEAGHPMSTVQYQYVHDEYSDRAFSADMK